MLTRTLARQTPPWLARACLTNAPVSSLGGLSISQQSLPSTSYGVHTSAARSTQQHASTSRSSRMPIAPPGGPGQGPKGQQTMSSARRRKLIQQRRKENIELSELTARKRELSKPDPVLGHQLSEAGYQLWRDSELCKTILSKDTVWGVKEDSRGNLVSLEDKDAAQNTEAVGPGPERLNFGLDTAESRKLLFSDLPAVAMEDTSRLLSTARSAQDLKILAPQVEKAAEVDRGNVDLLRRALDLRNASGKGIQVENIRRIRMQFGTRPGDERPGMDTGSVETQTAVLTYRIRNLHEHLAGARHDNHNRRGMAALVYQRMRLLKYLRRKDPSRYAALLPRIGVEARAVEGEIVVPGKPLLSAKV